MKKCAKGNLEKTSVIFMLKLKPWYTRGKNEEMRRRKLEKNKSNEKRETKVKEEEK